MTRTVQRLVGSRVNFAGEEECWPKWTDAMHGHRHVGCQEESRQQNAKRAFQGFGHRSFKGSHAGTTAVPWSLFFRCGCRLRRWWCGLGFTVLLLSSEQWLFDICHDRPMDCGQFSDRPNSRNLASIT